MNLNPEAIDHVSVEVFSDSDVGGITDAIETSESSGSFVATMLFLSKLNPQVEIDCMLLAGDIISAKYDDYTLTKTLF